MTEREFEATDEALNDVMGFVEDELERIACPLKTVMQITVAVEELFVNIAHYAYENQTGSMRLGIQKDGEHAVQLRFADRGIPFDPLSRQDPDVTLSAKDRKIGGLGIFLVKKTMDQMHYRYDNGENILTIRKEF